MKKLRMLFALLSVLSCATAGFAEDVATEKQAEGAVAETPVDEAWSARMYAEAQEYAEQEEYVIAQKIFTMLTGYRDSAAMAALCKTKQEERAKELERMSHAADGREYVTELWNARLYKQACDLQMQGSDDEARRIFRQLGNYRDSAKRAETLQYKRAQDLVLQGRFEDALEAFKQLGDCKDSPQCAASLAQYVAVLRAEEAGKLDEALAGFCRLIQYFDCTQRAQRIQNYLGALRFEDKALKEQNFEERLGLLKLACDEFTALNDYRDSAEHAHYCRALHLEEGGSPKEALKLFRSLGGYRDSEAHVQKLRWSCAAPGDVLTFGRYFLRNAKTKEPIEWIVLDRQEGRLLLISRCALDTKPYNEQQADVKWEKCSLRSWLNGEFLSAAFSAAERGRVMSVSLRNSPGGATTKDRVFCLSISEAMKYFSGSAQRACKATAYARQKGAWVSGEMRYSGNCFWWLRSQGEFADRASGVSARGVADLGGSDVSYASAVRPAFWVSKP